MRNLAFKLLPIFVIAATFLAGCISKPCGPAHLLPVFIGFPQGQLDTIVVRAYEANGTFNKLLDTLMVTKSNWVYNPVSDTTAIQTNYISGTGVHDELSAGYDWEIYIPAAKKSVYISQIMFDQTEKRDFFLNDRWGCISPILSYNQDGQVTQAKAETFGPYPNTYGGTVSLGGYIIYIYK